MRLATVWMEIFTYIHEMALVFCSFVDQLAYYAALLPRRGPHIASHSVCLSVRPVIVFVYFTVEPSYERTSKIEKKLQFSLMGQRHVCTFRHAQRAAYRTAISAAQACFVYQTAIQDVDELKRCLTAVCADIKHSVIDKAVDEWQCPLPRDDTQHAEHFLC